MHFSRQGSSGPSICLLNLMANMSPLGDEEVDALDRRDTLDEKSNRAKCRGSTSSEQPCIIASGPVRPLAVCPRMSRRSTNLGLQRALRRAAEIPIGIVPHLASAIGDRMHVNVQAVHRLAAEALLAQSEDEALVAP